MKLRSMYDILIFDTPPLARFINACLLINFADIKMIIARYHYTIRRLFSFILKNLRQNRNNNMCIVLNDKFV